jgi:hypothetical protein
MGCQPMHTKKTQNTDKKINRRISEIGFKFNILKTQYLYISNTEINGSMAFKYLGSIFTNFGKCNEVLNRTVQARKATRTLNSLLWSKRISLYTKK